MVQGIGLCPDDVVTKVPSEGWLLPVLQDFEVQEYGKRLASYIYPALTVTVMMPPSSTDILRVHHESELIEKGNQPPTLA
jgi:hypothetical protein